MELSIEAASDDVGVALSVDSVVALMATWETRQNHSVELLPNIDRLLTDAGRDKRDVAAVFVDIGPGGYAGLRVGVSVAKALAHALGVPLAGVGRLELDALSVATEAEERRIIAVHRAGRGEVAWAGYRHRADAWSEEMPPRITKPVELHGAIERGDAVTGDIDDDTAAAIAHSGAIVVSAHEHRVVTLARAGHARLLARRLDDATALVPLYLRAPAIGPAPSSASKQTPAR